MADKIINTYDYLVCGTCLCAYFNGIDSVDDVSESTIEWIREHYNGYSLDYSDLEDTNFNTCSICGEVSNVVDCTLNEWA